MAKAGAPSSKSGYNARDFVRTQIERVESSYNNRSAAFKTLRALLSLCGNTSAAVSYELLSNFVGRTARTVMRHVQWLEDEEFIKVRRIYLGDGKNARNQYRINFTRLRKLYNKLTRGTKVAVKKFIKKERKEMPLPQPRNAQKESTKTALKQPKRGRQECHTYVSRSRGDTDVSLDSSLRSESFHPQPPSGGLNRNSEIGKSVSKDVPSSFEKKKSSPIPQTPFPRAADFADRGNSRDVAQPRASARTPARNAGDSILAAAGAALGKLHIARKRNIEKSKNEINFKKRKTYGKAAIEAAFAMAMQESYPNAIAAPMSSKDFYVLRSKLKPFFDQYGVEQTMADVVAIWEPTLAASRDWLQSKGIVVTRTPSFSSLRRVFNLFSKRLYEIHANEAMEDSAPVRQRQAHREEVDLSLALATKQSEIAKLQKQLEEVEEFRRSIEWARRQRARKGLPDSIEEIVRDSVEVGITSREAAGKEDGFREWGEV